MYLITNLGDLMRSPWVVSEIDLGLRLEYHSPKHAVRVFPVKFELPRICRKSEEQLSKVV